MLLSFTKMHGCGNDYVYINCFDLDIVSPESLAVQLSNRHTGVGGDGLVLIQRSNIADAKMRMFNLDGSEGCMCGNAIRCVAKYLYDSSMVQKTNMKIETKSGVKDLWLSIENGVVHSVKVNMGLVIAETKKIKLGGTEYNATYVDIGNPHAVIFCENVDEYPVREIGQLFENKVNAEFVEVLGKNHLKMRVWERGSGETMACGTGACASAVAAVLNEYCDKDTDIKVKLLGGELIINYASEVVYMTGNCVKVFEGVVEIP